MQAVGRLANLNEIDLVVDSLKSRLAAIAEALKEPGELLAARSERAAAEHELAGLRSRQLDRELVQRQADERLARNEQRLYSGQVHNPKELQDLEAEMGQLRRQKASSEDELLEILIAVEEAEARLARARETLAGLSSAWESSQVELRAEQARLLKRLATEQARQAAARAAAPAKLLPLYDSLRTRRGGRAVATLEGDTCSACRVAVSPTKVAAVRDAEELVYCENCGRLLWGE